MYHLIRVILLFIILYFLSFSKCSNSNIALDRKCIVNTSISSFAFEKQDIFVADYFGNKEGGIFVEAGCYKGEDGSNTRYLEKGFCWSGFCIEPSPKMFKSCLDTRLDTWLIHGALCSKTKRDDFVIVNNWEGYSGLWSHVPRFKKKIILDKVEETANLPSSKRITLDIVPIRCYKLDDILYLASVTKVDYLSLDVEGGELDALKGIDFEKVKIELISVEDGKPESLTGKLLKKNGYSFLKQVGYDFFYNLDKSED